MIHQVIDQTIRRVFKEGKVSASEKIFSLFETHIDIIVKGSRDIQYGHKLNFSTGRSGMVLDVVIETGNPADSDQFIPMVDRHIKHYEKPPGKWQQMAVMPAKKTWRRPDNEKLKMLPSIRKEG